MITELYSNSIYMLLTILLFALAIDLLIGEFPVKLHPVVWIGNIISFFKKYLINYNNKFSGNICLCYYGFFINCFSANANNKTFPVP